MPGQFVNAWLSGIFIILSAITALRRPGVRYLNTLLSAWLFLSSWALAGATAGSTWNDVLVAIAVFAFSLVP
jgi:hypothetical protein